jgi:hypothetical protein
MNGPKKLECLSLLCHSFGQAAALLTNANIMPDWKEKGFVTTHQGIKQLPFVKLDSFRAKPENFFDPKTQQLTQIASKCTPAFLFSIGSCFLFIGRCNTLDAK